MNEGKIRKIYSEKKNLQQSEIKDKKVILIKILKIIFVEKNAVLSWKWAWVIRKGYGNPLTQKQEIENLTKAIQPYSPTAILLNLFTIFRQEWMIPSPEELVGMFFKLVEPLLFQISGTSPLRPFRTSKMSANP